MKAILCAILAAALALTAAAAEMPAPMHGLWVWKSTTVLQAPQGAQALGPPDYGSQLPQMLASLDAANHGNTHYLGWARHSYNDALTGAAAPASP